MGPVSTDDELFLRTAHDWLSRNGELFVERYRPHSGGSGVYVRVADESQLRALVREAPPGSILFVSRRPGFPIRGVVDDDLIRQAIRAIDDGVAWSIVRPSDYPEQLDVLGDGTSQFELQASLAQHRNDVVWVGPDLDFPNQYWDPDESLDAIIGRTPESAAP